MDEFTYSYHANSNPDHNPPQRSDIGTGSTAENNLLDAAYSQTFTYDPLNRLASNTLSGVANQSWTLDSQGNWSSFTSNGTTQTQTANAQNQITSISGSATPTYDANGNVTALTNQLAGNETLVYDAWNRLVAVTSSAFGGQVVVRYTYNALGYRVTETYPLGGPGIPAPAGTTKYLYYSTQEQVIEERWNGTAKSNTQYQYVWSASYVNAMILRDTYNSGTMLSAERIYTQYDANYNVTALVGYDSSTQTWGVVERFTYSPYGTVTDLAPGWFTQSDQFYWQYMYQGGRQDPITQLYHFDHRDYSASLGRFISQDPLQYINGANTYQFVMGNPVTAVDPEGLDAAGTALGQYLYWQQHTQGLVNQFPNYQGTQLGLLKGIAAASLLQELQAENQYYELQHQSPLQGLQALRDKLEKAGKAAKYAGKLPLLKDIADKIEHSLDGVNQLITIIKARRGLSSGTGPGQLNGLGNALLALGHLLPPGVSNLVNSYGHALSNAAGAIDYIDQQGGNKALWSWAHGYGTLDGINGPDVPFTPDWANAILVANDHGLPAFTQAYNSQQQGGGD